MELCDLPAFEIADLVKQKKVSAREVLDSTLRRIDLVEGRTGSLEPGEITAEDKKKVHSFITLTREIAQKQAEAVDSCIARGEDPGIPGRRAGFDQGYFLREGYSLHCCLAHPGQLHSPLHRHPSGTSFPSWRGDDR